MAHSDSEGDSPSRPPAPPRDDAADEDAAAEVRLVQREQAARRALAATKRQLSHYAGQHLHVPRPRSRAGHKATPSFGGTPTYARDVSPALVEAGRYEHELDTLAKTRSLTTGIADDDSSDGGGAGAGAGAGAAVGLMAESPTSSPQVSPRAEPTFDSGGATAGVAMIAHAHAAGDSDDSVRSSDYAVADTTWQRRESSNTIGWDDEASQGSGGAGSAVRVGEGAGTGAGASQPGGSFRSHGGGDGGDAPAVIIDSTEWTPALLRKQVEVLRQWEERLRRREAVIAARESACVQVEAMQRSVLLLRDRVEERERIVAESEETLGERLGAVDVEIMQAVKEERTRLMATLEEAERVVMQLASGLPEREASVAEREAAVAAAEALLQSRQRQERVDYETQMAMLDAKEMRLAALMVSATTDGPAPAPATAPSPALIGPAASGMLQSATSAFAPRSPSSAGGMSRPEARKAAGDSFGAADEANGGESGGDGSATATGRRPASLPGSTSKRVTAVRVIVDSGGEGGGARAAAAPSPKRSARGEASATSREARSKGAAAEAPSVRSASGGGGGGGTPTGSTLPAFTQRPPAQRAPSDLPASSLPTAAVVRPADRLSERDASVASPLAAPAPTVPVHAPAPSTTAFSMPQLMHSLFPASLPPSAGTFDDRGHRGAAAGTTTLPPSPYTPAPPMPHLAGYGPGFRGRAATAGDVYLSAGVGTTPWAGMSPMRLDGGGSASGSGLSTASHSRMASPDGTMPFLSASGPSASAWTTVPRGAAGISVIPPPLPPLGAGSAFASPFSSHHHSPQTSPSHRSTTAPLSGPPAAGGGDTVRDWAAYYSQRFGIGGGAGAR